MSLTATVRNETGKGFNRRLRQQGLIPAVIYGGKESISISMSKEKTQRLIQELEGENVLELAVDNDGKSSVKKVIIQEQQYSNWGNKLMHVDFLEVTDDTILVMEIPIRTTDNCKAVKLGGVLQTIRRTITVRCKAKDLPENILVDVENLNFGESIHVLDLNYPDGAEPVVKGRNYTVLTVSGRSKGKEEEETEEDAVEAEAAEEKE